LGWQKEQKTKQKEKYITGNKYFRTSLSEFNSSEEMSNYFKLLLTQKNQIIRTKK